MKILILSGWEDTGGQGQAIKEAFARHAPDWEVHNVARVETYLKYPLELQWPDDPQQVESWYQAADVVHVREQFWPTLRDVEHLGSKPMVIHHHGVDFRRDPDKLLAETREHKAVGVVSTVDLLKYAPKELEWLPKPMDLKVFPRYLDKRPRPVLAHAPTHRDQKDTELLLDTCARLQESLDFGLDLIERVPHSESIERKARADLVYDQLKFGIGSNALEAFACEVPVVSGVEDPEARHWMLRVWRRLPFVEATRDTLSQVLQNMLSDQAARWGAAAMGYAHVKRHHGERHVVLQLKKIYQRAYERYQHG